MALALNVSQYLTDLDRECLSTFKRKVTPTLKVRYEMKMLEMKLESIELMLMQTFGYK